VNKQTGIRTETTSIRLPKCTENKNKRHRSNVIQRDSF